MGWYLAGFDVTGVDKDPQPRYPFTFVQGDAIEYISEHGQQFDMIAGSPPCQFYTLCQRIQGREHPALIPPTREAMQATGRPWVMENVPEAAPEMRDPIMLCGASFGLHTYRHRLFEPGGGLTLSAPAHRPHPKENQTVKMGRPLTEGDWYHAVGNFSGVPYVKRDMGVPWMSREGIRECIPPAYTRFLGKQAAAQLLKVAA
jgi:DNA (cytosine-5)-methyltransferase 1